MARSTYNGKRDTRNLTQIQNSHKEDIVFDEVEGKTTSFIHQRYRRDYRPRDENGGCSFPHDEAIGYIFSETEKCDEPNVNAAMQGCCRQGELDTFFYNDFKSGAEDWFWPGEHCLDLNLGDISNINLNGFLIADHTGKKLYNQIALT